MTTKTTYRVWITTKVDHPELRGPTFPVVPPGWTRQVAYTYPTHAAAVAEFNRVLGGEWDFLSEYVKAVSVTAHTGTAMRTVRTFWVREERAHKWTTYEEARRAG